MDARSELILRCARRRDAELGFLSKDAYDVLLEEVVADVEKFVETPRERAMLVLAQGLERWGKGSDDDEFLDDEQFLRVRQERFDRLRDVAGRSLTEDETYLDAALIHAVVTYEDPEALFQSLLDVVGQGRGQHGDASAPAGGDAWDDLELRPLIRAEDALARACADTTRYRMAQSVCEDILAVSPGDAVGTRHTLALVLARLEDEQGFDELDARFGRVGSAWTHLGHMILLYKLGRMGAARRALRTFCRLNEGGAYALLRPTFVDTYMPDRPAAMPGSFEEARLAVHEADPIICDTPDLPRWAQSFDDVAGSAQDFAERMGYDW